MSQSEEKTVNLEELIYYMDQESADDFSQPSPPPVTEDTTEENQIDSSQEEDEEDDNSVNTSSSDPDDTSSSNSEPEEVKIATSNYSTEDNDDTEEEKEASSTEEPSGDSISQYYKVLEEQNLILPNEDFEFDGTEESLKEAIEQTRNNISYAAQSALWQALPDEWKPAFQYALQGGADVEKFLSTMKPIADEDLDVMDEDHQKEILRRYYTKTTNFSDEKVNLLVERASLANTLAEDAEEAFDELKQLSKEEQQKLLQKQAEDRQRQQEELDKWRRSVVDRINSNDNIQTNRKKKVQSFMLNQIERDGQTDTDFSRTIKKISANPEHLVQLADILADYDEEKGLDLNRFMKRGKTEATKSLKERLEEVTDSKTKVTGKGSKIQKQQFDWEEFLRQN